MQYGVSLGGVNNLPVLQPNCNFTDTDEYIMHATPAKLGVNRGRIPC